MTIYSHLQVSLKAREELALAMGLGGFWAENLNHPKQDWQYEVANGDTTLGYFEWCAARIINDAGGLL